MLNSIQVRALFEREAVLLGTSDGVPEVRAVQLFGKSAVEFAERLPGNNDSGFGIGDYTAWYLTFRGFQMAAAFVNVRELQKGAV